LIGGGVGGAVGAHLERGHGSSDTAVQPAPTFSSGTSTPRDTGNGSVASIAAKVLPSVVTIKVSGSTESGTGSGVILTSTGFILTNNHVVEVAANGGHVQVIFYNSRTPYTASIVGRDPKTDLAVIRVRTGGPLPAATMGRSGSLVVGDPVVAIGAPLDLSSTVTSGIVSALGRNVTVPGDNGQDNTLIGAIQTDAAINPGNSGGALVDSQAQVVGINSAIATAPNGGTGSIGLGFAIPIDYAKSVADEIIRTGKATHPYVGVSAQSVTAGAGSKSDGALVASVVANGPADRAGLRPGDVITKINDQPVDNVNDLIAATRLHSIGDVVTVTYLRNGVQHSAQVRLQESPSS
jgi:putative serine protease PepD